MNFIFWLSLAQAKQPYITEELQMWHTYLGGTLIIATQGPDAYKIAQKSLQKDPSIPARIAPIPQMGKTDIHLSKVLRVNKAQCVLWVQPPNKKYAVETFGNCPKERKIQVIHREQFQSYLERIEQEKIEQEKIEQEKIEQVESETLVLEVPKSDTNIKNNKETDSNNEMSLKKTSTEDTTSLEVQEEPLDTSASEKIEQERIEQGTNDITTTIAEEPAPELEKTFEPITMTPKWVPNQDWGVFDSNGTFIPPLTFSILAEYKPLEVTLRNELKQMNQKSSFIGLFSGALAVGGLMKLMTSTSSDTYVNVHSAWTSMFLFSTSGLFLYAKGIPAKELKIKQFALANYMTYEEAVLIDIQRQLQTSDDENKNAEGKEAETGEEDEYSKGINTDQKKQSQDAKATSTGKKRKLTFKKDLIQSQNDSKKEDNVKKKGNMNSEGTESIKKKTNKDDSQSTPSQFSGEDKDVQDLTQEELRQETKETEVKPDQSNSNESSIDGDKE